MNRLVPRLAGFALVAGAAHAGLLGPGARALTVIPAAPAAEIIPWPSAAQLRAVGINPDPPAPEPQTGATYPPGAERLTASQLAAVNRAAGFTGTDVATMTAIQMGESGGRPAAHNDSSIEDSRGISQINTWAHPQYDPDRLYDPDYNARAAYEVGGCGDGSCSFQPWSVYTGSDGVGSDGPWLRYIDEAREAAG